MELAALEYIARQAGGSMRDAISLLDQLTAYGGDTITLAQVQAVLGVVASQAVIDLADSLIDGDLARGLDIINQVVADGAEPRQFTREFVEYVRGLLLLKMGDGSGLLRATVPDETLERMQEQVTRLSPRTLLRATRLFNAAALEMKVGFLPQLPLELAFVETVMDESASAPPPTSAPRARTQKQPQPATATPTSSTKQSSAPSSASAAMSVAEDRAVSVEPAASVSAPTTGGELSFDVVNDNWPSILEELRQADKRVGVRSVKVGALLGSVALVGVEGAQVIVEASSEWLKSRVEEPSTKMHVEQYISEVVGSSARLRCVLKGEYQPRRGSPASVSDPSPKAETGPAQSDSTSGDRPSGTADAADSEEDPMLQEALSLGAEIKNVD